LLQILVKAATTFQQWATFARNTIVECEHLDIPESHPTMAYYPGGWGGGYQPGFGGGKPGFGGGGRGGPGGNGPGNQPGNTQPLPSSQDPNSAFYGTPYPPNTWPLGRFPTIGVDVPIMLTFAVIFLIAMILHLVGTFINAARGHKVLTSLLLFCN
jgi:hypothetical protein